MLSSKMVRLKSMAIDLTFDHKNSYQRELEIQLKNKLKKRVGNQL